MKKIDSSKSGLYKQKRVIVYSRFGAVRDSQPSSCGCLRVPLIEIIGGKLSSKRISPSITLIESDKP